MHRARPSIPTSPCYLVIHSRAGVRWWVIIRVVASAHPDGTGAHQQHARGVLDSILFDEPIVHAARCQGDQPVGHVPRDDCSLRHRFRFSPIVGLGRDRCLTYLRHADDRSREQVNQVLLLRTWTVRYYAKGKTAPPSSAFPIVILDDPDQADAKAITPSTTTTTRGVALSSPRP